MSDGPSRNPSQFNVGSHVYELIVGISDGSGSADTLDTQCIEMLSFDNKMNRLYNTGYIEYIDDKAIVDKYLESDNGRVSISFAKKYFKRSGDIVEQFTETRTELDFLIDSAQIKSNDKNVFKYRINLISESFVWMHQDARQSTYGDKKKSPTDIIQDILKDNIGIGVNEPSFKTNASKTLINYITNDNDDGYSSIDYLLNKTIYNNDQYDETLKTLVYDQETNVVFLFDIGEGKDRLGTYDPIEVKVIKNEQFPGYQTPTLLGYTNKGSRQKTVVNAQKVQYVSYNIDSNAFNTNSLENQTLLDILNGKSKAPKTAKTLSDKYSRYEAEWNNNIDLYHNLFTSITQNNGLITCQEGKIGTMAGYTCQVSVPNNFQTLNTKKTEKQQETQKYQTITGQWDIYEVESFISPIQGMYRQKLVLYRNSYV